MLERGRHVAGVATILTQIAYGQSQGLELSDYSRYDTVFGTALDPILPGQWPRPCWSMVAGHIYPGIYTIFSLSSINLLHIVFNWVLLASDDGLGRIKPKKEVRLK